MMNERSDRLALLLDRGTHIADPMDPATWLIAGKPASPGQVALLRGLSLADMDDAVLIFSLAWSFWLHRTGRGVELQADRPRDPRFGWQVSGKRDASHP